MEPDFLPDRRYLVLWAVEVDAPTPETAALIARVQQLNPDSVALKFVVKDEDGNRTPVDLAVLTGNDPQ